MRKEKNTAFNITKESVQKNDFVDSSIVPQMGNYCMHLILQEKDYFVAILNQNEIRLSVAVSCLVRPQIGDLVLSSVPENSTEGYILAILERSGDVVESEVLLPGNALIAAPNGTLSIQAENSVYLSSPKKLCVEAKKYVNNAEKVMYNNNELTFSGKTLRSQFKNTYWHCRDTFFIKTLNSQFHCKNSLRRVTRHEEFLTQSFRHYVENNWVLHTKTTSMYADETTSIQASLLQLA